MLSEQRLRQDIQMSEESIVHLKEQAAKCKGLHEAINLVEVMENTYRRIAILKWVLEE